MNKRQFEILAALIAALIAAPTVSPPARNTKPLQQKIAEWLKSIGFDTTQILSLIHI